VTYLRAKCTILGQCRWNNTAIALGSPRPMASNSSRSLLGITDEEFSASDRHRHERDHVRAPLGQEVARDDRIGGVGGEPAVDWARVSPTLS
jgi:hypothetical protein